MHAAVNLIADPDVFDTGINSQKRQLLLLAESILLNTAIENDNENLHLVFWICRAFEEATQALTGNIRSSLLTIRHIYKQIHDTADSDHYLRGCCKQDIKRINQKLLIVNPINTARARLALDQ